MHSSPDEPTQGTAPLGPAVSRASEREASEEAQHLDELAPPFASDRAHIEREPSPAPAAARHEPSEEALAEQEREASLYGAQEEGSAEDLAATRGSAGEPPKAVELSPEAEWDLTAADVDAEAWAAQPHEAEPDEREISAPEDVDRGEAEDAAEWSAGVVGEPEPWRDTTSTGGAGGTEGLGPFADDDFPGWYVPPDLEEDSDAAPAHEQDAQAAARSDAEESAPEQAASGSRADPAAAPEAEDAARDERSGRSERPRSWREAAGLEPLPDEPGGAEAEPTDIRSGRIDDGRESLDHAPHPAAGDDTAAAPAWDEPASTDTPLGGEVWEPGGAAERPRAAAAESEEAAGVETPEAASLADSMDWMEADPDLSGAPGKAAPAGSDADLTESAFLGLADRLERIAVLLRERAHTDADPSTRGADDPLEILITGYALGYAEARRLGLRAEPGDGE